MKKTIKTLIVGAGEAGRMLMEEYIKRRRADTIAGFVDDDEKKVGRDFGGSRVLNSIDKISDVIREFEINEVIIAMPSASQGRINKIINSVISTDPGINIHLIPSIEKYFESVPLSPALQDITITDMIGRDESEIDIEAIGEKFTDKTILVTGAGGSIGSEICRQLMKFRIKKIIALGRGENSIFNLIKSLNEYLEYMKYKPEVVYKIIDVKDYNMCGRLFTGEKPDIVIHAAAHKHVPLMEYNAMEAVLNNVGGTLNLLKLSLDMNIEEFVFISTDKAVNPVSVMGATKRISEMITEYYYREKGLKTSIVRFGNVVGSRGSVVPLFREQIKKGGPVTVTHPEITRYFMSIPEASILVLNAAAYSNGGDLFVLDMGKQYKLMDIAKRLIEFYGYTPQKDIEIKITGLRPGEKMYEELNYNDEDLIKTDNEKIYKIIAGDNYNKAQLEDFINAGLKKIYTLNPLEVRKLLKELIPEYDFSAAINFDNKTNKFVN